jgi:hypothetical protein
MSPIPQVGDGNKKTGGRAKPTAGFEREYLLVELAGAILAGTDPGHKQEGADSDKG